MGIRGIQFARVFADLELNTKGFKAELSQSEKSLGRITNFIQANPMAAAGSLAAAFILVGLKATQMASQTEAAVRRIGAVLPDAVSKANTIKTQIDAIATSSGRSQEELFHTAEIIAKGGVANTEELLQRLRVIQTAADATGADLGGLATGLDQVLDTFGLQGDQIEEVAAKLKAAGAGKEPIEDLIAAFQTAAPTLKASGVSFDVATNALARFVAEGLNSKQANRALTELVTAGGAKAVEEFGGKAIDAAKAISDMNTAANLVANGADRLGERIRANLNQALREIGDQLLPLVNQGLQGVLIVLDHISGRIADVRTGSAVATINTLAPLGDKLNGIAGAAQRLEGALGNVAEAAFEGRVALSDLSATDLETLQRNVAQAVTELGDRVDGIFATKVQAFQAQISAALAAALSNPPPAPTGGRTTSSTSTPILTDEQKTALKKGLVDTFTAQLPRTIEATTAAIVGLAEGLTKLGVKPEEITKAIKPLIDRLKELRSVTEEENFTDALFGAEGAANAADPLQRLSDLAADLVAQINAEAEGSERVAVLKERLLKVTQEIAAVNDRITGSAEIQTDLTEGTVVAAAALHRSTEETIRSLAQVARGAIGVAQAFGLAGTNAAAMLQNVLSVADAIPGVISQIDKIGKVGQLDAEGNKIGKVDKLALAGNVVSILGGIAGVLGGLGVFGDSEDKKRDQAIREANTEAIRQLTKSFNTGLTGQQATTASSAISALLNANIGGSGLTEFSIDPKKVNRVLSQFGLDFGGLLDILKEVNPGLKINTSSLEDFRESLKQVQQAIAEVNFRAFADSFAGQLELLQDRFDLMDLTNPLDQLQAIADLASKNSPVVKQLLAGLNLNDPSQRAEAERRLLELFDRLGPNAKNKLTPEELGNLSSGDLRDLIKQIEALIDQQNEADGTTSGGQAKQETFGVTRTITDSQADKLIGLEIGQLDTLVEIRDLLAFAFAPVVAPALPVSSLANGAGLTIGSITVNLGDNATPEQAFAAGQATINGIAEQADKQFGLRLSANRSRFGNAVVR